MLLCRAALILGVFRQNVKMHVAVTENIMTKREQFSAEEISAFCSQTAMVLNGGIPLYEGMHILTEQFEQGNTRDVLNEIDDKVHRGNTLYVALKESGAFPEYMCEMVKVGETTGKIENIMRSLASFYEREGRVKESIKSVISYPTVLFLLMAVIVFMIVFKIIPMFQDIFLELEGSNDLSAFSGGLLAGRIISGLIFLVLVAIVVVLIAYRTRAGYVAITGFLEDSLLTHRLADKISVAKFISALSVMVSGGVESVEAVKRSGLVVDNKKIHAKVNKCITLLSSDKKLNDALMEAELIDPLRGRILGVAEISGNVDEVLEKISSQYDEEVSQRLAALSQIIETVLIVLLAIFVGAILLAIMAPLIDIISSIA